jgi:hypothetical protein
VRAIRSQSHSAVIRQSYYSYPVSQDLIFGNMLRVPGFSVPGFSVPGFRLPGSRVAGF